MKPSVVSRIPSLTVELYMKRFFDTLEQCMWTIRHWGVNVWLCDIYRRLCEAIVNLEPLSSFHELPSQRLRATVAAIVTDTIGVTLDRVDGRHSGLPGTITALIAHESFKTKKVDNLNETMQALLDCILRSGNAVTKLNSLRVIRFLFNDRSLAAETHPFTAQIVGAALSCFRSGW
jgi:hypothetical protein